MASNHIICEFCKTAVSKKDSTKKFDKLYHPRCLKNALNPQYIKIKERSSKIENKPL